MALIKGRAGDRVGPRASTRLARIGLRTRIAVIACYAVVCIGIAASASCWIARARHVTLIKRPTCDRVCPCTRTRLACIRLRTCIAVTANGAIRRNGIATCARGWIACTHNVTLIERRADDGARARTCACLARVGLGTRIVVVAGCPVWLIGVAARTRRWIARSRDVALIKRRARNGSTSYASASLADIILRTCVIVTARRSIVRKDAPTRRTTRIIGARIAIITNRGRSTHAGSCCAHIRGRTRIAIITRCGVRGIHTACRTIAGIIRTTIAVVTIERRASIT